MKTYTYRMSANKIFRWTEAQEILLKEEVSKRILLTQWYFIVKGRGAINKINNLLLKVYPNNFLY